MAKKGKITIDREKCKGCWLCIGACPVKILETDTIINASGSYPVRIKEGSDSENKKCIACGSCFEICPDVCIEVYELGEGDV